MTFTLCTKLKEKYTKTPHYLTRSRAFTPLTCLLKSPNPVCNVSSNVSYGAFRFFIQPIMFFFFRFKAESNSFFYKNNHRISDPSGSLDNINTRIYDRGGFFDKTLGRIYDLV